ncbi:U5 small nuclear ribonucleoprotein component [Cryptococcus deuterogattii 99/473]|uniref:U5 small nuclear ribonucleoprotein component n=1 Tax=Cryptococcus deuterogattii Ram5 TaxID=1296110 RepID=A0A0D0T9M6_9TREE|nr:U5 small nuclear ribonucleoprotein component [Cryptococcus deuterogattii LA55]KIR36311.1 U5 small nuclear ribonucleoprotein component [Cryptococcus deuterogattii MMRL2647]KIR42732.1 U5 small nuclear ribonucleoprotein component [Cryptococcus deuterogattii Ram5]KIR75743.1 U5 small nuclear ribonucleoprotein component [Cryptococcus deuterogattii CA1014]KIR95684.1 U5 small nuclear ribonucleoprotein component [Cryptococcus deuterogattii CBS 10090]KIY59413.1 U5 small nuclear ribonucleoprotein comp
MSTEDYDEFGNYIGGDLDSDNESDVSIPPAAPSSSVPGPSAGPSASYAPLEGFDDEDEAMEDEEPGMAMQLHGVDGSTGQQVVLHEDKKYYATAEETYGPDVEALVQEEDLQPLSEPIVQPIKQKSFTVQEKGLPETRFDRNFMIDLMDYPSMIRNVMVAGHIHHGKTSLLDMLVFETHKMTWDADQQTRYTDTHILSRARGISVKSGPMSLVLQNSKGKSNLINIIDTPGHANFVDEVASIARLTDGVVIVVDVVEGVMHGTEQVIRHAMQEKLKMVLVVNKMDRLILELRLPPSEAFFKIKHTIEEVNSIIASIDPDDSFRLSPERGNVAFSSTQMGWCFTLKTFANMYADTFGSFDIDEFALRLWGNIYFDPSTRKFTRKPADVESKRSFVHFILEPLYKLYTQVLSADQETLKETLADLQITLKPSVYKMDVRPLLKVVLEAFFGPSVGLIDMITEFIPSPQEGAEVKIRHTYTGPLTSNLADSMLSCDPQGPTVVHVTKLYHTADAEQFRAFGRVMSGTVKVGQVVKVLGEGYSLEDEEDMINAIVEGVMIDESRYNVDIERAPAGNLVLLSGVDASISKTATIVSKDVDDDLYIFRPIKHMTTSVLKVAVEPVAPSNLPKMLDGLRKVNKSYPLVTTKVEESGEHIILGTGELYMDSILHDLRKLFSEIEIKVSDPVTKFCETVVETSALKCYAETPNKKNKLTMISEPLEAGIAADIEAGRVSMKMTNKERGKFFESKYQWDLLASRNIWAFGPDENGPNALINDTLPSEVDSKLLSSVKESVKQGFQWGTREGPLCDEPIRGVKFRILDASLAQEPIYRGGGQIIPTARRVCYSSFLLATPRLLEPVYYVEVQAPADCVAAVYTVLSRRRGHVTKDIPKPGSPLYTVKAFIPVLDANGFETDLRTATLGQAFCQMSFDHWSVVPGDPTDSSIQLRPLEPAMGQSLARDLVLKTRRRKGLSDSIAVSKYLEDETIIAISASGNADLLG